ncbi:MAG TPA: hypothetical protein VM577_07935 [Anaerovoracaceae bacterium]|nr:hypothetical protein [Anaerovoracaceae bacterium]
MVVQSSNQIDVYVEPYQDFVTTNGEAKLDKKIALAYKSATNRKGRGNICSSIQKGYIFAWESQSADIQEDFQFALSLDYEALQQKYEEAA